jgi:hypothetical protein
MINFEYVRARDVADAVREIALNLEPSSLPAAPISSI